MEKIKNIYCWNCLRDWIDAQELGMLHVMEMNHTGDEMFGWERLIHMMYADCFPQCFLCFRKNNENYLLLTKEQVQVFEFIKNKVPMQEQGKTLYYFNDFSAEYKNKILNAHIESIWIKLNADENCI